MKTYLKLAWRNIWRSRVRTILTVLVVMFVVLMSSMMSSQQYGLYDKMIENITEFSGHLTIQDTSYKELKSINYSFEMEDEKLVGIENTPNVKAAIPRFESFSLASYKERSKGIMVLGIDPDKEKQSLNLEAKLANHRVSQRALEMIKDTAIQGKMKDIQGRYYISANSLERALKLKFPKKDMAYFSDFIAACQFDAEMIEQGSSGVLLGEKLALFMEVNIGDTLVLIGQGYHGVSAAGLFPVTGIVKLPMPDLERSIVFMELNTCQYYFSAPGHYTSLSIRAEDRDKLDKTKLALEENLPGNMMVETWKENQEEAFQMIESDKTSGVFMKGIFYMIVGFIIFGTVMMMVMERKREFGIVIALGMHRWRLSVILFIETLFVSFIGAVAGMLISGVALNILAANPIPLQGEMVEMMEDFGFEPVLYFSDDAFIFLRQTLVIFIVAMVIYIFPWWNINKLNIIKAIRG